MERNTVIGIILLGLLLTIFTIVNQPSEKEIKEKQRQELALKQKQKPKVKKVENKKKTESKSTQILVKKDSLDTTKQVVQTEEILTIENEKLRF
ncbi:MAG: hypothetical protein FJX84_08345, partial [Bacteroidetes bacterium]|nr:hypothetical protein [Bacteroidota bacterium]